MNTIGGDGDTTCVVCGARLEPHPNNHHCDPVIERRVEAGRKSWDRDGIPSLHQKLRFGFSILDNNEDCE